MFDTGLSDIHQLVVHHIGNKIKEEELRLSREASGLDEKTKKVLWKYVKSAFQVPSFFQFQHAVDLDMNPVYTLAREFFRNESDLVSTSSKMAKLLYQASQHPQIRSGELFVIHFDRLNYMGKETQALGLFKSEVKQPFLFTEESQKTIELYSYKGIHPTKVDKACLIFDSDEEEGYQILCVDNRNRGDEAKFWMEDFLGIKTRNTGFTRTETTMALTKQFIETELPEELQIDRTESIDLLNRTANYFKENEQFDQESFSEVVFRNEDISQKFRSFTQERSDVQVSLDEPFDIDQNAVKRKSRIFKSILKLDKNFHVYIHGNREMIEKGVDETGRKFYKLYYEEEQ